MSPQRNHLSPEPCEISGLQEQNQRGERAALADEPGPVRVTLSGDAGSIAVTVAPLAGDPRRVGHVAALRHLDAPAGAPGLPLLLYLALQRARVWRRTLVVAEPGPVADLMDMSIGTLPDVPAQYLDLALHHLFAALAPDDRARAAGRFPAEAAAALGLRARAFADNAWCRAVREDRLARAQYVAALANTHQYVRWTPRLLARAIAAADDEALRDHFFRHLRGEQKHERLIESDLRYLGADVAFITGAMAPAPETLAFMALQESLIGFHQDPVRFLAAPFVAEGLVAHIEPDFLGRLAANIRRWGYAEPARATRFLAAHARADGGEDGHFARTAAALARLVRDDAAQQRLLSAVHLAADAFTRSYDAYAAHFDLSFCT